MTASVSNSGVNCSLISNNFLDVEVCSFIPHIRNSFCIVLTW